MLSVPCLLSYFKSYKSFIWSSRTERVNPHVESMTHHDHSFEMATEKAPSMVTAKHRAQFDRNGFVVLKQAYSPVEMDEIDTELQQYIKESMPGTKGKIQQQLNN